MNNPDKPIPDMKQHISQMLEINREEQLKLKRSLVSLQKQESSLLSQLRAIDEPIHEKQLKEYLGIKPTTDEQS